jgi:hypothetical protein
LQIAADFLNQIRNQNLVLLNLFRGFYATILYTMSGGLVEVVVTKLVTLSIPGLSLFSQREREYPLPLDRAKGVVGLRIIVGLKLNLLYLPIFLEHQRLYPACLTEL